MFTPSECLALCVPYTVATPYTEKGSYNGINLEETSLQRATLPFISSVPATLVNINARIKLPRPPPSNSALLGTIQWFCFLDFWGGFFFKQQLVGFGTVITVVS